MFRTCSSAESERDFAEVEVDSSSLSRFTNSDVIVDCRLHKYEHLRPKTKAKSEIGNRKSKMFQSPYPNGIGLSLLNSGTTVRIRPGIPGASTQIGQAA